MQAVPETYQPAYRPPHLALLSWVDQNFVLLPESDDRLMVITNFFRNSLIRKQVTATGKPEIEARMGRYHISNDLPKEEKAFAQVMLSCGYLQILPYKQEGQGIRNFFRFISGIREDHFFFLRDLFEEASLMPNSQVINKGHTLTLDTIYSNRTRVSKNLKTGEITESIEKLDRTDLNIQNCGFDIRITSSIEQAQEETKGGKVNLTRRKSRYSYDYEFMGFDLTQIKASNDPNPTYEVEMEVRDIEYVLKYVNDHIAFNKLVLRFISNMQSLYYVLNAKFSANFEKILNNSYDKMYGIDAPKAKVGGYLKCMAYKKTLEKEREGKDAQIN